MTSTKSPQLSVRFETDSKGCPEFIADGLKHKHYKLIFEIQDPSPDTYAVTFELHESYYDPIQTVRADQNGQFCLPVTSYGDYAVKVRLRTKYGEVTISDILSRALRRTHAAIPSNPAINEAIEEIASL